jgi:ubiquinone/menaquinone biosynthesis C-methylase UbiE
MEMPAAWKRLVSLPWDTIQLRLARRKTGEEFLRYFVDLAGLKPDEAVLDVGCGRGRMAASLTHYLSRRARYEGFDIIPTSIAWCTARISRRCPNFHFTLSEVFNAEYNPGGKAEASAYVFPYPDESFDFVFLTSVFTHMLPKDLEHYLSEIARVTKTGGRCLVTFFLLNAESLQLVADHQSSQDFRHVLDGYRTTHPHMPEAAIAYPETWVRDVFRRHSFSIQEPIHPGSWCGRKRYLSYQDIVLARKD